MIKQRTQHVILVIACIIGFFFGSFVLAFIK